MPSAGPELLARHWHHVYALSLAVHCTSWTFYGTVTQGVALWLAAPPTFLGAIVLYALAVGFLCGWCGWRANQCHFVADLIATRLGKDWLAATVTLVAALGNPLHRAGS
jgi:Na+/proline symporter